MGRIGFKFLPVGAILDRYVASSFIRIFFISLLIVTLIYTTVDFFDRIGALLDAGAPLFTIVRYFFFKAPLLISRVIGFAVLFSTLFCLGALTRTHEITAIRAGGITVQRIALPLLILSLIVCALNFLWNETLVPLFAHNAQTIYTIEIKNKQQQSLLGTHDMWIRAESSFININNFDPRRNVLENVTVFLLNRDFSLRGLLEVPHAQYTEKHWTTTGATEWSLLPDGKMARQETTTSLPLSETPADLQLLARDAEEFTFFDLQKQIADMKGKGIDTTYHEVDLQMKLALPFISPLMVLLAIPFAIKRKMTGTLSLSFGVAMMIAFGYWVLTAFCLSLGHSGAMPALLSAWAPNAIFAMIGLFFFTAEE
jgi:lipopolysaccharide export system permease protein